MKPPYLKLLSLAFVLGCTSLQSALAQGVVVGPGSGPPPTPVLPNGTNSGSNGSNSGGSNPFAADVVVASGSIDAADQATPEITALASALKNDPLRIYEWVVNNVQYEFYWGLRRGAQMTLLDRVGNDWDQSALLGALLKAAGYTPSYRYAYSQMPWSTAVNYLGMAQDQIQANLTGSGFPILASDGNSITFGRMWVTANIGGNLVVLDPSFKQFAQSTVTPLDLTTVSSYSAGTVRSVTGGTFLGGFSNSPAIQYVNSGGLRSQLATWTTNAVASIQQNHAGWSGANILGIRTPSFQHLSALPTALPGGQSDAGGSSWSTWSGAPFSAAQMSAAFYVTIGGQTVNMPLCAYLGQKLAVWFSSTNHWQLYLGDTVLAEADYNGGQTLAVQYGYTFPVGFGSAYNLSAQSNLTVGQPGVITYGTGAALGRLKERLLVQTDYQIEGLTSSDRRTVTEELNVIGLQYQNQAYCASQVIDSMSHNVITISEFAGLVSNSSGPNIDLPVCEVSICPRDDSAIDYKIAFGAYNYWASSLERVTLDQAGPFNAFCATSALEDALNDGLPVCLVNSITLFPASGSNPPYVGYTGSPSGTVELDNTQVFDWSSIVSSIQSGGTALMAGNSAMFGYEGGCILNIPSAQGDVEESLTAGGLHGGMSTIQAVLAAVQSVTNMQLGSNKVYQTGADPVDLVTGAFLQNNVDLALGLGGPKGLNLQRSYNGSLRGQDPTGLGPGWTHSYDIRIQSRSPNDLDLRQAGVAEVLPLMMATRVMLDTFSASNPDVQGWVIGALAANWGGDRLLFSRTDVVIGNNTIEFVQLPDQSYVAPANVDATLQVDPNSGTPTLSFRNGNTITFAEWNQQSDPYDSIYYFDSISDPYGNKLTATYTTGPNYEFRIQGVTDCYGRTLTFSYGGNGVLTGVSDSTGRSVSYSRDGNGNLIYTDPENQSTTYFTDSLSRITSTQDGAGRTVVANAYDEWDRVTTQESFGDSAHSWAFGLASGESVETDPVGNANWTYFDERGRKICAVDQVGNISQWAYDGVDELVQAISPSGATTSFAYDQNHDLIQETDPLGHVRNITNNAQMLPSAVQDFEGEVTAYQYNSQASVTQVVTPTGQTTNFSYDSSGDLISYQPPEDSSPIQYFNFYNGMPQTITYPNGYSETVGYDARGNRNLYIDRRGVKTTYAYNNRNQLEATYRWYKQNPGDPTLTAQAYDEITYDAAGNPSTVVTGASQSVNSGGTPTGQLSAGRTTTYAYDALGHLVTINVTVNAGTGTSQTKVLSNTYTTTNLLYQSTDALGNTTTYSYDADRRLTGVTDPLGHETLKTYDADGHVNGVQYPAGNLFSMEYDLAGRQIAATDGKSNMVTYGYDPDGRMTSLVNRRGFQYQWAYNDSARTDSSTTPTGSSTTTEFAGTGLPTQVAQPSGQVGSFTGYDAEGRLTDYSDSVGTKHMTYWENGLLHQVTMSPAGGGSYTSNRNYDEQNRLSEYDDGFGNTFLYTYYPDNRLDTVTYPGGNVVTYTYDDFGRMSTVTDWAGRVTTYGYDAASRLISIARPNQTRRALAYYGDSRLMQIQDYKSNGTILFFERLSYDANGRVASTFLNPANPAYTLPGDGLTFDGDNALLTWSGSGGSVSVVRDADGNMTQGPLPDGAAGSYVFDSRDRLVSAGTVSGYSYNPDELRVGLSGPSGTVSYAIDPNRSLSSVMVRNQGGSTTYYVYGLGLLYEDTDGSTETYHFDHAGNTVALTAQDGQTVTDRVSYSTYGNVTSRTGTTGTPFLFGGEVGVMTDPNGLYYMRARYYNPRIMRFVNADPIRFGGGTNWYAYCLNDPVANIDPTGLGAQGAMQAINDSVVDGGRLPAFVTHATAVAEDIITWAEGTGDAAELTALWATGLGKPTYHFDSTYALTRLMENAPGVRQSIAKYTALNQGNGNPASYEPLTNNAVGFGLNGYLESGLNPAEQFIGGYNVTITPNGASNINITITNVTSLGSLLADNWQYSYPQSPKHITPGGNQTQTYTWTQPYP